MESNKLLENFSLQWLPKEQQLFKTAELCLPF